MFVIPLSYGGPVFSPAERFEDDGRSPDEPLTVRGGAAGRETTRERCGAARYG
jgi:hypothetical protein